jgi:hypothetical protein
MARVAQTLPLISRVRRHIPVATMIFVADQKLKEEIIVKPPIPLSCFCQFGLRLVPRACRIVCNPQHDRLGGSLFRGVSKRTHFLTPRAPMIWIISQQARDRRWCVTQHSAERSCLRRIVNPVLTQSWVSIVTTMRLCRASFRCHPVAHASRTLHFAERANCTRSGWVKNLHTMCALTLAGQTRIMSACS